MFSSGRTSLDRRGRSAKRNFPNDRYPTGQSHTPATGPGRSAPIDADRPGPHASYTSVCSAISRASFTSMPRWRTVLSNFVCARSICTARRFLLEQLRLLQLGAPEHRKVLVGAFPER
jgi:hypothetical protein